MQTSAVPTVIFYTLLAGRLPAIDGLKEPGVLPHDGAPAEADPIAPNDCWALRLGKSYGNGGRGGLACQYLPLGGVVLEIPMAACGVFFGLLPPCCVRSPASSWRRRG
jgi:hypothetical protein